VPEYVTTATLTALLGPSAAVDRVTLAVGAANLLVEQWCEQKPAGDPPVTPPAPVTPVTSEAALELAHALYRAHAAVGGVFAVDDLLARMPADRVRPIRDLLDAEAHAWGIG
jgi:hypothetical protein